MAWKAILGRLLGVGLLLLWAGTGWAAGGDATASSLLNMAGRQRMLVERIVKSYLEVGLGINPDLSRRHLAESVARFEEQFRQIKGAAADKGLKATLAEIDRHWWDFRVRAAGRVTKETAVLLYDDAEVLVRLVNLAAGQLEAQGAPGLPLVNLAGRQRMLSQRLAMFYMMRAWGLDVPLLREEMETAKQEFDTAMQTLYQAPENTPDLRRELEAVLVQWTWFKSALELEGSFSYRLLVAEASEAILRSLETVVGLYERLPR